VQGSDFQFKKLHAKAPQIKGIDFVRERESKKESKRGDKVKEGVTFHHYNKFQSKNLTKGTASVQFCLVLLLLLLLGREVSVK